ncbi:MAG: LytTR family DNA-binding domain-containing protein [Cytophagaceae bacterium]|nr:LytTR family DNA-binding domain-containing protein [Cytophagaceae bacterium]
MAMVDTLSCILVDDDPISLEILESLVEKTDFLQLVGVYNNALEAAQVLHDQSVDLLILDIEMPGMTGLQLIETLETNPQIILVSARSEYALEAFAYDVTDFLLKPIESYTRFLKAALKARRNHQRNATPPVSGSDTLFIKVDSMLVNFDLKEIRWIEAYGDYVKIHTESKSYTVHATLKTVEDSLPPQEFVRIHRSFLVRIDQIKNIDSNNLQVGQEVLPISNSYRPALFERIRTL